MCVLDVFYFSFPQIPYIETSAKDPPLHVDSAFHEVVRVIRNQPIEFQEHKKKKKRHRLRNNRCNIL